MRMEVFNLWGWPQVGNIESFNEAKIKQEAEKKIEDLGLGECVHCKEELVKNERGVWESEFLVEYCKDARDHKHRPRVKIKETNE